MSRWRVQVEAHDADGFVLLQDAFTPALLERKPHALKLQSHDQQVPNP